MDDVPPKRGRGRPRKTPAPAPTPEPAPMPEPEEVIIMGGESAPVAVDDAVEEIELQGYTREPDPEPEPAAPAPEAKREPDVVYITQPQPDEAKERARRHAALTKVKRYRESFPAVRAMPFSEDWSTSAIESHLEDVRIMVSSRTTGLIVKSVYVAGVRGIEAATTMAGMKTYGLADLLSRNSEIDSILTELQAELGVGNIPPAHRLALATLSTVFVLDSSNRKAETLAGLKTSPVNVELKNRYGDL